MRAVLAFPPLVSPTYTPLALATLAPYIRREAPGCELSLLDLNIELWHHHGAETLDGRRMMRFMQGLQGDFFDQRSYLQHHQTLSQLNARFARWSLELRRHLEEGAPPPPLLEQLSDRVLATDPELIGFSVTFPGQLLFALALARIIGQRSAARIILGGASMSSVDPEELLRVLPEVEAVLLGEGEPGAGLLFSGASLSAVPGLVYRQQGEIHSNRPVATTSPSWLPAADFTELDLPRYFNPTPVLPVMAARGCQWRRCRFCAHNFSFAGFRARDPQAVVEDLQRYQQAHGAEHFYLVDQEVRLSRLSALCSEIAERSMHISFQAMCRPTSDFIGDELRRCYEAGCHWICWGVESGSQRLLDLARKGTDVTAIKQVLTRSHEAGISNLLMLIFGLPTSTDQDLQATLDLLESAFPLADGIAASNFVLFAGTSFARGALQLGLKIQGAQQVFNGPRGALSSTRLSYREVSSDGSLRPPRGAMEVETWERRRRWLGELPFVDQLCAEHYLLFTRHATGSREFIPPLLAPLVT